MSNNVFGDVTGAARYYLTIPIGHGTVRLHREILGGDELLAEVSVETWKMLHRAVELECNLRSKADGFKVAHFRRGDNQLSRPYGHELAILMWAVERETDAEVIATARRNWQTLSPEERWWWFRQAYASNSALQARGLTVAEVHSRGWCGAVREGLCTVYTR